MASSRGLELEQRLLESRLRQQQLQSEEDSKWLLKEENNLKKRLSITASTGSDDLTGSTDNMTSGSASQRSPVTSSPRQHSLESKQEKPTVKVSKMKSRCPKIAWLRHMSTLEDSSEAEILENSENTRKYWKIPEII